MEASISRYWLAASAVFGSALAFWTATKSADASATELSVHPPHYPFHHDDNFGSYDHFCLRRGFQVYMEVTNACHGVDINWRNHIKATHTEEELIEVAAEYESKADPNEEGEVEDRPSTPGDKMPMPYENDNEARYMNDGALPPTLTKFALVNHSFENYIFGLMTGYIPPPIGEEIPPKLYYNMYFQGGFIAMPPPLRADMIEYEDGTKASVSQMAKDVTAYLRWVADPYLEVRRKLALRGCLLWAFSWAPMVYWKKFYQVGILHRRAAFVKAKPHQFY